MPDINYSIPPTPTYDPEIRMLQDADPASASNTFNPLFLKMICNTHAIKLLIDEASGSYSVTPLVGNLSCEFRMDFPVKSVKFGYYALAIDGLAYTGAAPVNQPLRTSMDIFSGAGRLSVLFYDLRDIMIEDWGDLTGQGWDSLLNQRWFTVTGDSPVSLELTLNKISELAGVQYGTLKMKEVTE